jgi:hypothetical protein
MQFRLRFDIEVIKPWIIAVIGTRFGFALYLQPVSRLVA